MKLLPFAVLAVLFFSSRLPAEVIFSDDFNAAGSSSASAWYVRGENLRDEDNVEGGNLLLARKDGTQTVPKYGGVWKSFDSVSLNQGESLKLTIVFSGAEVEARAFGFFRIVLADSQNRIDANGGLLTEPDPRFFYALGLPSGTRGVVDPQFESVAFFEGASGQKANTDFNLAPCLLGFMAATPGKPIFPEGQKCLVPGEYANKATLVWELRNDGGTIVSRGALTDSDGVKTDMLEARAETILHFDFNKVGIGFAVWDADYWDGRHLAESVSIDSVKLEKF